jgi:hypothetical protein
LDLTAPLQAPQEANLAHVPIPKPSFLDQCVYIGGRTGEKRWRSKDRTKIYTCDFSHGEIEVFNRRGCHLGVLHAVTGKLIKGAVAGRKIDV